MKAFGLKVSECIVAFMGRSRGGDQAVAQTADLQTGNQKGGEKSKTKTKNKQLGWRLGEDVEILWEGTGSRCLAC